jgi:hypothetical protein
MTDRELAHFFLAAHSIVNLGVGLVASIRKQAGL